MSQSEIYKFNPEDAYRFATEQGIRFKQKGDTELQFQFCPYCKGGKHRDKSTFSINLESGAFFCQRSSCGAKGNMLTLHRDFGFSLGADVDNYYSGGKYRRFKSREGGFIPRPSTIKYLADRGISERVTRLYEITQKGDSEEIIVFPFYDDNGVLWFIKYRNTKYQKGDNGSKEWCERDRKPILFGMNHCNPENKTLVMTEGQIDSLSCAEAGIENAVSVPTGKNGFTWVPYCWTFLGKFEELIIFGDNENGEITLLDEMKSRFHGRVKVVREEDYQGCKDANELLVKHGKEAVKKAVENAVPLPVKHIKDMADVESVDLTQLEKMSTGFKFLDKLLSGGFYFGQLVLLTGRRGEGKSTLGSQFATQALKQHYNVFMYSGELADWNVKSWIDFQIAGNQYINTTQRGYGYSYFIKSENLKTIETWYRNHIWLYDNEDYSDEDGQEDVNQIFTALRASIEQYNVRFAVIDNLMTAIDFDNTDVNLQQTRFVQELKGIARRYNIVIILVAHPRKENATTKYFSNDDVAGSSNITNLTDTIIKYSRAKRVEEVTDKKGNVTEKVTEDPDNPDRVITVHKNRFSGKTDANGVTVYYQESSKRISEDKNNFDWEIGWEQDADFISVSELDTIPF